VNTGNPIRKEILNINKEEAYKVLKIDPDIPFVLSFGGSGGQKRLNDAMYYLIKEANNKNDVQIIHVTGKRFYDEFLGKLKKEGIVLSNNIRVLPYMYQIPEAINIASIVVTSAGAITLAEISAIGVPSILIPKSYTAENHQEYNARAFEEKGASILVLEKDLKDDTLYDIVYKIINNKKELEVMRKHSKELGKIHAAEKIYELVNMLHNQK
jgi:UDP-N-acetylglucosamine--N-acetylmuramyl-(pentapeptide) pyrophosphoryl-undecaprenol N-acetylglucosamine transferase